MIQIKLNSNKKYPSNSSTLTLEIYYVKEISVCLFRDTYNLVQNPLKGSTVCKSLCQSFCKYYNSEVRIQMEAVEQIQFQITTEEGQTKLISFDKKILHFRIEYLNNNHHQPYPIPENIAQSTRPFEIMRQFLEVHNYDPSTIKIIKPIRSSKYWEVVDPLTFKIFQKYTDQTLMKEVEEVIILSRFLRFQQLTDAISAAVAVNFYINLDDEKQLEQYKKREGLEDISSQQICEIIELYQPQFKAIQYRAKQELLKITQSQAVQH